MPRVSKVDIRENFSFRMETDISELVDTFEKLPKDVRLKALKPSVRFGMRAVMRDIQTSAPVRKPDGKKPAPGRLRRNIKMMKPAESPIKGWVAARIGYPTHGRRNTEGSGWYWMFVERGTRRERNYDASKPVGERFSLGAVKIAPQRFVLKAGKRNLRRIISRTVKSVKFEVRRRIRMGIK